MDFLRVLLRTDHCQNNQSLQQRKRKDRSFTFRWMSDFDTRTCACRHRHTRHTDTHTHVHLHRVTLSGKFEQATQRSPICLGDIYNLFESFCLLAQVTDVGTKAFDCGKHAPASAHVQLLQKRDCKNYLIKKSDGGIILELWDWWTTWKLWKHNYPFHG